MNFTKSPGYCALQKALSERPGDFVAVVGAGLSAASGLPTWQQLSLSLINEAEAFSKSQERRGTPLDISPNFEKLKRDSDLWKTMAAVKTVLQGAAFEAAIKRHLRYENPPTPPNSLINLWKIGIKGVVTPNLDSLAADAFACCFRRGVDVSSAMNTTRYLEFIGDERRFVFQPHGQLGNPGSWVMTPDALATILKDASYKSWWDRLLASRNLIFLGVNESDVSIKSYILDNSSNRSHFVIAPDSSATRFTILKEVGFQHVPYRIRRQTSTGGDDHSELEELIESLVGLTQQEVIPPAAYEGDPGSISDLPTPEELQGFPIEKTRHLLNAAVASILPEEGDVESEALAVFDKLRRRFLLAFTSAAAVDPKSEYNMLHGYRILDVIGEGAFGRVYLAEWPSDGKKVAIKVIHPQMLSSGGHLNAFRRGAHAMRLLTKKQVSGMVPLVQAFEVPFSIVMEYVEGLDLEKAIDGHRVGNLASRLRIIRRVAEVVHAAHSIREQVLHRDLKPGNILLSGYSYEDEDPVNFVKVVDFDLCWHKYATAETIVHHKGSRGYAAPEMFDRRIGSTRRSSVDVYGLGMLLYFVLTGNHPTPGMTARPSFETELAKDIRQRYRLQWSSLGWHLARTVAVATNNVPTDRCTLPDMIAMLDNAISLEDGEACDTYLPIVAMQVIEAVVGVGVEVRFDDFRRIIEHTWRYKLLRCVLSSTPPGFLVTTTVRMTKDKGVAGCDQEKRDHKVADRIRKEANSKNFQFQWEANRSMREAIISHRFSSFRLKELGNFSDVLRRTWEEIDKN